MKGETSISAAAMQYLRAQQKNIVDGKHMDFKKEIEENYMRNGAGRALFCSQ